MCNVPIKISKGTCLYDPTSPSGLRWFTTSKYRPEKLGNIAGHVNDEGYWRIVFDGRKTKLTSHIIWEYFNPLKPIGDGWQIDHRDGDTSNNCITNLRRVVQLDNNRNKKAYRNNTSGKSGVKRSTNSSGNSYWSASYHTRDKQRKTKYFSVDKLGEDEALNLATQFRESVMKELLAVGDTYTIRHGK